MINDCYEVFFYNQSSNIYLHLQRVYDEEVSQEETADKESQQQQVCIILFV